MLVHTPLWFSREVIVPGAEVAEQMRYRVRMETQLTCSVGLGPNTMLAKVASDINKPNGQFALQEDPAALKEFVQGLSLRKVPGIGKVKLIHVFGRKVPGIGKVQLAHVSICSRTCSLSDPQRDVAGWVECIDRTCIMLNSCLHRQSIWSTAVMAIQLCCECYECISYVLYD